RWKNCSRSPSITFPPTSSSSRRSGRRSACPREPHGRVARHSVAEQKDTATEWRATLRKKTRTATEWRATFHGASHAAAGRFLPDRQARAERPQLRADGGAPVATRPRRRLRRRRQPPG